MLVATCIFAIAAAIVGVAVWRLHADALAEAGQELTSLAGLLAEQAQQSAQAIDLAINEVDAALAAASPDDLARSAASNETLRALAAIADRHAAIDLISIDDANGTMLATSRGRPAASAAPLSPLFDFLKHNRTRETHVGAVRVSEATGALVVDLFRRLEGADGGFLGVVRVSVTPQSLVSTYSPISSMPGRSYALFARDGAVLVRYPESARTIGARLPPTSDWYGVVAQGGGVYEGRSSFDNLERLIAVRPLPFSQFVVSVSILRSTALSHWRDQIVALVICSLLALLIAAFLVKALMVQFRKLADKEAVLRDQSRELELSNARFATALGNMSQGLVVFDRGGRVVIFNARYATLYGLEPDQIQPGMRAEDILRLRASRGVFAGQTPESYVLDSLARQFTDQRIDHLNDGRSILVNHAVCPDGGIVVTHEDVTEREQANTRIAHMAMHDELTQLANRALFRHTLEALRREIGASYRAVVVMLVDLDDFKPVNDTYGHVAGDSVLRECALRISAAAPYAHVVARLGGDEFAIAFGLAGDETPDLGEICQGLIDAVSKPYATRGHSLEIGACVGAALHRDGGLSIDDMMRRADLALYAAKAEGARRCRVFEPQMELVAVTRRELAVDLARAIARGGLHLAYQPVVDADTLDIRQMEALLRWSHPRRGEIPPQEFVRLAEETHLIDQLGAWVIARACADLAQWPAHVGVAVNVSPLQLASDGFTAGVLDALARAGVAATRLELEITESVLLQDNGRSLSALHRLREHGVAIALDDFGTGFSSMSYLKQFPFDRLKIDRSFVADIARDAGSAAIIAATVNLARAFDIEVTAEGVETYEQYQALRASGVRHMQGYLFGRPQKIERELPVIGAVVSISSGHKVA